MSKLIELVGFVSRLSTVSICVCVCVYFILANRDRKQRAISLSPYLRRLLTKAIGTMAPTNRRRYLKKCSRLREMIAASIDVLFVVFGVIVASFVIG